MCGAGNPQLKNGLSIHHFSFDKQMSQSKWAMYSSDADILIVPQQGVLLITTEFGRLTVGQLEICVIPRGVKYSVDYKEENGAPRGWLCEVYKGHF